MQSNANIQKLYQFDPFPNKGEILVADIGDLYVPFDELRGVPTESILLEDLNRSSISKFYSVIGDSGVGKSSVLNYWLYKLSLEKNNVFCIKLNEFAVEINNDPKILLAHILKKIYKMTTDFKDLGNTEKIECQKLLANNYSYTNEEGRKLKAGVKAWFHAIPMILGIEGDVGGEISKQTSVTIENNTEIADLIDFINQTINILHDFGKEHVLIMFDETDRLITPNTNESVEESAITFFETIIPVLRQINCSFVFVLNSQYSTPTFQSKITNRYFDKSISIPKIQPEEIFKIITKRTNAVCDGINLEDIWESDALHRLTEHYGNTSLRNLTTSCKYSIEKAWKDGAELITGHHAKNAIQDDLELLSVN